MKLKELSLSHAKAQRARAWSQKIEVVKLKIKRVSPIFKNCHCAFASLRLCVKKTNKEQALSQKMELVKDEIKRVSLFHAKAQRRKEQEHGDRKIELVED